MRRLEHRLGAAGLAAALSLTSVAQAVPTLFFDGGLDYVDATQTLSFSAGTKLSGTQDLADPGLVEVAGSSLALTAELDNPDANPHAALITGLFKSPGGAGPDLSIVGGDSVILLEGDIVELSLTGVAGFDQGSLSGTVNTTGGALLSDFGGGGSLIAFVLNLTVPFSGTMFDGDFSAQINAQSGAIQAIPEPPAMALVLGGLVLMTMTGLRNGRNGE